jgi:glutamate-ammonia-ligase adenylyltransferase
LDLIAAAAPQFFKGKPEPGQARLLTALFSGSEFLSTLLIAHPDYLPLLSPETLRFLPRKQGLSHEIQTWLLPALAARDYAGGLTRLREFKQREMLRIAAKDLADPGNAPAITAAISDVADVCLETVWTICRRQLVDRLGGEPWHQDASGAWHPTAGCMLGMGKLGGQELNYSSDIDVLFLYDDEGGVFKTKPVAKNTARPIIPNHQFFNRLAEACIAEIARMTTEGMLFRIDLRLRPEGDSGPLSRSLASYENYYAQWGQTWERMMLIKTRGVAGDSGLAAEFLEMIQPFRYPRSMNQGVLREVAEMKERIETEVVRSGELERNVKLGRGGIREIEFVAQSLQLLHAGRQPFLQGAQTLPCLGKLAEYELLTLTDSHALHAAYCFLRDIEHRLQMEKNLQTHTIPEQRDAQQRLARLMGFKSLKAFERIHRGHRKAVRRTFEKILQGKPEQATEASRFPREFEGQEDEWKKVLRWHGFKDLETAHRVLREFVQGPGYVHVSPRTIQLAHGLLSRFFALCPQKGSESESRVPAKVGKAGKRGEQQNLPSSTGAPLSDPDRVLTRLESFIAAYGARATLFELWNSTPTIFELLIKLFDRSEFLAELAIRTPDLVDELVTSGRLSQRKTAIETLTDLRYGINDPDQHLWIRRYHQAELMRIGLRDILGLAEEDQYLTELSALAEACLQYALEVVMRKNKLKTAPFAIIGLGKLGGAEIDYGSDLDIVFVTESAGKNLTKPAEMARATMDLLTSRTELGIVFQTDARLRPDGEKGLLVNSLQAYEDYYRQRAMLWEIQSLTRSRAVAGNRNTGEKFQELANQLSNFQRPSQRLRAYSPDWKSKIQHMRSRIEKERTPAGKDALAIKTGKGGLMDAEFLAQILCMENGWHEPNTLRALEHASQSATLHGMEKLIANYRRLRRLEGILRRWSYEGETVLPDEPAAYARVAIRCGFRKSEGFAQAVANWRQAIRDGYAGSLETERSKG